MCHTACMATTHYIPKVVETYLLKSCRYITKLVPTSLLSSQLEGMSNMALTSQMRVYCDDEYPSKQIELMRNLGIEVVLKKRQKETPLLRVYNHRVNFNQFKSVFLTHIYVQQCFGVF